MRVYPVFENSKQQAILDYLSSKNERDCILFLVGSHTGLRVSDIVKLRVEDFKSNKLEVVEQKTKKTKIITISNKLRASINRFINNRELGTKDYLFKTRQSSHISTRRVQQIIKAIARILDIDNNINSHSMRKTFAYNLYVKSNYNIALVMQALNHSKESITLRYLCIADKLLDDIMLDF